MARRAACAVSAVGLACLWLCGAATPPAFAGPATGTQQASQLYTAADPAATGGLRGRITPGGPAAREVLVQDVDNWKHVYRARVEADGHGFVCTGLPVGRYDLVIVGRDAIWEGLTLARDADTLEAEARAAIEAAVGKATPFFDQKRIERVSGAGGDEGTARAFLQEVRTRPVTLQSAEVRADIQVRSLKLVLLERVGRPGWAIVHSREFLRQEVAGGEARGLLAHQYVARLGGIRVLETVKDLGELALPAQSE